MTDYERGSAAWDIGAILTRHTLESGCARREELVRTAGSTMNSTFRLERALNTPCTCGVGDSSAESTSQRGEPWLPKTLSPE